jgi:hypothetical protein
MQMRIWAILGVSALLAAGACGSSKSEKPASETTSGAEHDVKKAANDTGDKVDEAADDVGDKVEEGTK